MNQHIINPITHNRKGRSPMQINWPKLNKISQYDDDFENGYKSGYNAGIGACIKAYEESKRSGVTEVDGLELANLMKVALSILPL